MTEIKVKGNSDGKATEPPASFIQFVFKEPGHTEYDAAIRGVTPNQLVAVADFLVWKAHQMRDAQFFAEARKAAEEEANKPKIAVPGMRLDVDSNQLRA